MSVFTKYTFRSLIRSRTRTVVTVIGILLSVAMFTAVTESFYSGRQYLVSAVENTVGSFYGQYTGLDRSAMDSLGNDPDYTETAFLQNIGYARVNSDNEYMPYIRVYGMSENYTDLACVRLREGRMPEKADEIVISRHLFTDGAVNVQVGDTLTLSVGQRELNGEKLFGGSFYDPTETLTDIKTRVYKVTGICERPDRKIELTEDPGYSAFTLPEEDPSLTFTAFFRTKKASDMTKASFASEQAAKGYGAIVSRNNDLLTYMGQNTGNRFYPLVTGLSVILILIITAGSVALIYNSFSISVNERIRQFGLLRSLGATDRQIVFSVLTEALILCAVGVPLGLLAGFGGISVTFSALRDQFGVLADGMFDVRDGGGIRAIPNASALLAAALLSVLTALFSAYLPVRRAMRMSAIEAIRLSGDITDSSNVRESTGKKAYRRFGFEAMLAKKNFARNRRQYRSTVVSLAMSLVLFISASSLCLAFNRSFELGTDFYSYDVLAEFSADSLSPEEGFAAAAKLCAGSEAEKTARMCRFDGEKTVFYVNGSDLDESYTTAAGIDPAAEMVWFDLLFADDAAFRELCELNGISAEEYFSAGELRGVLYDENAFTVYSDDGDKMLTASRMISERQYPSEIGGLMITDIPENTYFTSRAEDGNAVFYDYENDREIRLPETQCGKRLVLTVGAKASQAPFCIPAHSSVIVLPLSSAVLLAEDGAAFRYEAYLCGSDSTAIYEKCLSFTSEYDDLSVYDRSSDDGTAKALIVLVSVFSYGFIALISLISAANVFNTVSTNIMLRRRELAMLRSVGLSEKGLKRMMRTESLLYGFKSILIGLPCAIVLSLIIFAVTGSSGFGVSFALPWGQILLAVFSVFAVVFASMIYSVRKIGKYNMADELKNENV